jgi:mercuric ion binding protein
MKLAKMTFAVLVAGAAVPVFAATQKVALDVPGMTCSLCPITIKKALDKVPGVSKVDFNLGRKEAFVTFDDTKTTVAAITKATADAGYPSEPKASPKQ